MLQVKYSETQLAEILAATDVYTLPLTDTSKRETYT
jgi:hypothetical protein